MQEAKITKATREMTRLDARAEKRNGVNTVRIWGITIAMPDTHWTKTNKTAHHGTKAGKTRKGQNRETPRNYGIRIPNIISTVDTIANKWQLK